MYRSWRDGGVEWRDDVMIYGGVGTENEPPLASGGLARGGRYWRRPTFARPIDALSSGLQRFTSVFGMGTGGTTVPWSPDCDSSALECMNRGLRTLFSEIRSLTTAYRYRKKINEPLNQAVFVKIEHNARQTDD